MIFRRKPAPLPEPGTPREAAARDATATIATFEAALARHEALLHGLLLHVDCLALLYAGEPDLVETHRKQFRNIIQQGRETGAKAARLLDLAKLDPHAVGELERFTFRLAEGVPRRETLLRSVEALCAAWARLFPGRATSETLPPEDLLRLIEATAEAGDWQAE